MRKRFCDDFKNINPQTLFDRITQTATMETSNRPETRRRRQSGVSEDTLMVAVVFQRGGAQNAFPTERFERKGSI